MTEPTDLATLWVNWWNLQRTPYLLARSIYAFHSAVLKRANEEFANLREQLRFTAHRDDKSLKQLKTLKAQLPTLQRAVVQALEAVNATEQGKRIIEQKQFRAEQARQTREWHQEVAAVSGVGAEEE